MGATSFACPSCKKVLKSNTPLPAGKIIKCPGCQTSITVPAANGQVDAAAPPVAPAKQPAPTAPAPAPASRPPSSGMFDLMAPEPAAAPPPPPSTPAPAPVPLPKMELPEKEPAPDALDEVEDLDEAEDVEDDDDDRPRGKKKGRDDDDEEDDDDDRPRGKKKGRDDDDEDLDEDDEDDDDDRPRAKKKGRDDDEDDLDEDEDDDRPRGRKKSDEEDEDDVDEDEDDDRPRGKKKDEEEDEDDDRPRGKKKDEEEDEDDDRPRGKKKDEEEDEDDDRPRGKKSRGDDEEEDDARPAKKKSADDDEDDRPSGKKKSRGDDDDDEDDRPARKKKRRGDDDDGPSKSAKGKNRASGGGLVKLLMLAVVGIVGLTVVVGGGWYAASWLFGGSGALAYMPPDCDEITGINFAAFDNAGYKKSILFMHNMLIDDDADDLRKEIASIVTGKDRYRNVVVVQMRKAVDPELIRKKDGREAAETMEGKTVYRKRKDGGGDKELLAEIRDLLRHDSKMNVLIVPSSTMFVEATMSETDLKKMLNRTMASPSAEMLALARRVQSSAAAWEVYSLEPSPTQDMGKKLSELLAGKKLRDKNEEIAKNTEISEEERRKREKEATNAYKKDCKEYIGAFKGAKACAVSASVSDPKTLKLELRIEFTNEANAHTIEKPLAAKDMLKLFANNPIMGIGPLRFDRDNIRRLMPAPKAGDKTDADKETEMEKTMAVQVAGSTLTVSATIGDETWRKIAETVEEIEKNSK